MKEYTERLVEARNRAWEEARSVVDLAEAEKREMTSEESEKFDRINADIEAKDERIASFIEAEKREAKQAELRASYESLARPAIETPAPVEAEEDRAANYFRNGTGAIEFRAVQVKGTATAGGNTVPTDFYHQLVAVQVANSAILGMGPTFLDTDTGTDLQVPTVTGYGAAVAVSENATAAAADDAFGMKTLKAFKHMVYVQVSRELISDSGVDIVSWIANDAGRKLVNAYGAKLVTGTGTAEPQGIFVGASAAVTAASASFTADNLVDLQEALLPQHQANAVWIMSQATRGAARKLKDSNNRYLFDYSTVPGIPPTILGAPALVDPNAPAATTGLKSIAYGNPAGYFVRRAEGVRFERSDEFGFDKDLVTFKAVVRIDGQLVDTSAFKLLVHS